MVATEVSAFALNSHVQAYMRRSYESSPSLFTPTMCPALACTCTAGLAIPAPQAHSLPPRHTLLICPLSPYSRCVCIHPLPPRHHARRLFMHSRCASLRSRRSSRCASMPSRQVVGWWHSKSELWPTTSGGPMPSQLLSLSGPFTMMVIITWHMEVMPCSGGNRQ
ncbi:hypothetical protein DAEQUDRAFT_73549 [Daedalea quercina L-15889]|uniref:Uncharacterized protein n=1 Tax=Daedalea quercina L-15889 TaxID=1314783 RepID=A0A165L3Q6_9APHY|nr:hypothetical protein DAEQUDRAFT_73549 [Daedalea quercina L-15889]